MWCSRNETHSDISGLTSFRAADASNDMKRVCARTRPLGHGTDFPGSQTGRRSCKYLNNRIEQDHRRVKQRIGPMLGFKRFDSAAVTISGIELAAKIKKEQFKVGKLPDRPTTVPAIWTAVVAD